MKKTYKGKIYDTDEMTLIEKVTYGVFGDPAGYEETLYQAENGTYFLYAFGGEQSPYPAEKLVSLTKAKLEEWQKKNSLV